jgi:hypothetical protein
MINTHVREDIDVMERMHKEGELHSVEAAAVTALNVFRLHKLLTEGEI